MNKEEVFATWAPEASLWSRWVKPVLFAHIDLAPLLSPAAAPVLNLDWAPAAEENVALVLDLPGAEGVTAGVALATRGYRPVPLYNAVPLPSGEPVLDPLTGKTVAAVEVVPILLTLRSAAEPLGGLNLPPSAPPAFLLDANRHADGRKMLPEEFDNRSVCFTTDFPSANFLMAHGVRRALLIQRTGDQPKWDLAHTLRRWQEAGLAIERKCLDSPEPPTPIQITRPPWFGAMFQRALAAVGFRRGNAGGFGNWVPVWFAGG